MAYINELFSPETIQVMREHPSFTRLMEAARAATAGTPNAITTQAALARHMNESDQTIYNWKKRGGVSKEGAIKAERLYGTTADFILQGEGSVHVFMKPPAAANGAAAVAQSLSYLSPTVEPKQSTWGDILAMDRAAVPATFSVPMPDGALLSVPRGQVLWFRASSEGRHDVGALFEVDGGQRVIRRFELVKPGHFRAVATAPGYESFDSAQVRLEVLAVMFGREDGGV
ncbi:MAG TPA: hypothetical protein VF457_15745 [Burkholderiaceae bacterium]